MLPRDFLGPKACTALRLAIVGRCDHFYSLQSLATYVATIRLTQNTSCTVYFSVLLTGVTV